MGSSSSLPSSLQALFMLGQAGGGNLGGAPNVSTPSTPTGSNSPDQMSALLSSLTQALGNPRPTSKPTNQPTIMPPVTPNPPYGAWPSPMMPPRPPDGGGGPPPTPGYGLPQQTAQIMPQTPVPPNQGAGSGTPLSPAFFTAGAQKK